MLRNDHQWPEFYHLLLQDLHSVVIQKMRSAGLDPDTVSGLSEVFDPNSLYVKPFQGLETQYLQQKYFRENLSMGQLNLTCDPWHRCKLDIITTDSLPHR